MDGISTASKSVRRARPTKRLAALVVMIVLATVAGACESFKPELDAVRSAVNVSRAQAGLPALRENFVLDVKADSWAQTLRSECRIRHSRLASGAPPNWQKLGENVGMGGNIAQIHTAYMNSPGHRANVLDSRFTEIGTAAVWGECRGFRTLFTVHVFMAT